ncbi:YqkE family protein [Neobacillus mesonae]|nr:YqkE family protein [Neobacillus mesonae]
MGKKKNTPARQSTNRSSNREETGAATLKDMLSEEILGKLKAQASEIKAADAARQEEARRIAEEKKKAEQKKLDNNFEYLLNNSSQDWHKYK